MVSVNGAKGNGQAMIDVVKKGGILERMIQRDSALAQAPADKDGIFTDR